MAKSISSAKPKTSPTSTAANASHHAWKPAFRKHCPLAEAKALADWQTESTQEEVTTDSTDEEALNSFSYPCHPWSSFFLLPRKSRKLRNRAEAVSGVRIRTGLY